MVLHKSEIESKTNRGKKIPPKYVILLPNNPTDEEEIAASELSVFFFEATGIKIDTVFETDYEEGKYISIGKTQKLKENGIVVNTSTLTSSGYVIKRVDDNLFIAGGTSGVVFGVYGFLNSQFNYKYFDDNLYVIDKEVTDLDKVEELHPGDKVYKVNKSKTTDEVLPLHPLHFTCFTCF